MKILLAVDGSEFSEAATQALASHVRSQCSEVLAFYVVEPLVYSVPPQMAPGWEPEQAERDREEFKVGNITLSHTAGVLRAAGFKVEPRIVEAEPRSAIIDVAQEWNADLIVLGSH